MQPTQSQTSPANMCLPPIMHGTGLLSAIGTMASGSTCVTLASRSFNPEEVLKFHEAVADALVVGITDEPGANQLRQSCSSTPASGSMKMNCESSAVVSWQPTRLPREFSAKTTWNEPPNSNADYKTIQAFSKEQLASRQELYHAVSSADPVYALNQADA